MAKRLSYLEACMKKPGFRREFYKAQVQDVLDDLRFEIKELKRRVRLAHKVIEPLVDWEMGENSRGENSDPLRAALSLLDLRKPIRRRRK